MSLDQNSGGVVLVVDDEPDIRELIGDEVRVYGLEPCFGANGREALVTLDAHRDAVRAIVSDVRMPIVNGVELLAQVRKRGFNAVPFIFFTGFNDMPDASEYLELGATGLFRKPRDYVALLHCLTSVLKPGRAPLLARQERHSTTLHVDFTKVGTGGEHGSVRGIIRNISTSGMNIACDGALPEVADRLVFRCRVGDDELTLHGEVRWVRAKGLALLEPGFGVASDDLAALLRKLGMVGV